MTFKSIAYDSSVIESNKQQNFSLFNNEYEAGENEARRDEILTSQWLAKNKSFKELLFAELEIPFYSSLKLNVTRPIINSPYHVPGDVDMIIVNPDEPNHSIAIEFKKVNVIVTHESEKINKIEKIKRAINQTNGLLELGFHKVYLAVVAGSFGAKNTKVNFLYRGMTDETFQKVYDFPDRENLDDKVGLIFIEIIQPTLNPLDYTGMINICIENIAKEQDQPKELTNKIKSLFV